MQTVASRPRPTHHSAPVVVEFKRAGEERVMQFGTIFRRGLLVVAAVAVSGGVAASDGRAAGGDVRTLTDDKCVAQCDEDSDKCMIASGQDTHKQKECDITYEACLRKCN
jgi:hypothetical protein